MTDAASTFRRTFLIGVLMSNRDEFRILYRSSLYKRATELREQLERLGWHAVEE